MSTLAPPLPNAAPLPAVTLPPTVVPAAPNVLLPLAVLERGLRRFTVLEYERPIELGFLAGADRYELLDGYLVPTMGSNPPHDSTIRALAEGLRRWVPAGWMIDTQFSRAVVHQRTGS